MWKNKRERMKENRAVVRELILGNRISPTPPCFNGVLGELICNMIGY
jgi:hypothetical protein